MPPVLLLLPPSFLPPLSFLLTGRRRRPVDLVIKEGSR